MKLEPVMLARSSDERVLTPFQVGRRAVRCVCVCGITTCVGRGCGRVPLPSPLPAIAVAPALVVIS